MMPSLGDAGPKFVVLLLAVSCASSRGSGKVERSLPRRAVTPVTAPRVAALRNEPDRTSTSVEGKGMAANPGSAKSTIPFRDAPEKTAEEPRATPLPRITSVALFTYIYDRPGRHRTQLGYVHVGSSVALRSPERVRGPKCAAAWYAVEPRGWICNDTTTILETSERQLHPSAIRFLRSRQETAPAEGSLPYRYALSLGAPMYGRIPDAAEQQQSETTYGPPGEELGTWAHGHDGLATSGPVETLPEVPWFFANGDFSPVNTSGHDDRLVRKVAPRGSMISFGTSFEAEGRTWLVTPELSLVPADRVRVYRTSSFHGRKLDSSLSLPIAWMRKQARPKYRREVDGRMVTTAGVWNVRTAVGLTGNRINQGDCVWLETVESGMFIDEQDATVVEKSSRRPYSVGPDEKWIQISISSGTLAAYVGDEPVFTTLVSPGRGGLPRSERASPRELAARHTTPLGVYRIQYKDRYAIMSPDPEQKRYFLSDVPHIQYFRGPYALHAAFWHEDFGEPHSGGCVNLSPQDAEHLFSWTDPPIPSGWQSVRSGITDGEGTLVQIVR